MRHAGFLVPRRRFDARFALIIAVAALIAAGAAVLTTDPAGAQTAIPKIYAQALENGAAISEPVIDAVGASAYYHVELRVGGGTDGADRVTYGDGDISRIDIQFRQKRDGDLLNVWDGAAARDGVAVFATDGTTAGSRLTECDGIYANRCEFLPSEWKELAGQSSVTSQQEATTNIDSIKIAFTLPEYWSNADEVVLEAVFYPNAGGQAWSYSYWSVNLYEALIVPTDASGNPFFIRHDTSAELYEWLQYPFAAGQLSHVRLSVGLDYEGAPLTYDRFDTADLQLWTAGSVYRSLNSEGRAHEGLFFTTAGEPLAACTSGPHSGCRIDATEWRALAGQTDEAADAVIKPIRVAFKVPLEFTNLHAPLGTFSGAFNDEKVNFGIALATQPAVPRTTYTTTVWSRLSAHLNRLQSGWRDNDGNYVALDPQGLLVANGGNGDIPNDRHQAITCLAAEFVVATRTSDDCTRAVEVGENVYLENILQVGGTDTTANDGRTAGAARVTRATADILYLDAAKRGAIFDRIKVQATHVVAGDTVVGGGVVAISSLCPVGLPAEPEHPSVVANVPRARTAEALATCEYTYNGGSYWGGKGVNFFPTVSSGPVTITLSYHKGTDDTDTADVDESLVARDTLEVPVAAATDNTDTGNERVEGDGGSYWDESEVTAELDSRSREDSLVLLIGHRRNRAIPEFWRDLASPSGPGSVKGATYATVDANAAVALTVPAGGGTLSLLGTAKSCTAGASACTLTLTRADLKEAALYGGPEDTTVADIDDDAPYWPARLRFEHAAARDVTISGVLTLADGTTTHEFQHVAKGTAAAHGAIIGAWLPEDADDTLAPSQTSKLAVGYRTPAESSGADSWRIWSPIPQFYEVTGYTGVDPHPTVELIGTPASPLAATMRGTYLQLTGPAVWSVNGSRRLRLDMTDYTYYKCVAASALEGSDAEEGRICYVTDAEGDAPSITVDPDAAADAFVTASVPIWTMFGAVAPDPAIHSGGPNHSYLRSSDAHWSQLREVFGRATVRVQDIKQLSGISLDRKPGADNVVPTTPIRVGSSGEVRLALLNENGGASQLSAVSAVTLTVIGGGTLSGQGCTNASSCTIPTGSGVLFNAAKANPAAVAAIDLRYSAPTKPGSASIRATVVGTDGGTFTETLDLTISGSATELAVGGTMPRVHSSATANDDRDKILIPITARDANGNAAPMPRNAAASVTGVGDAALPTGSHTATVRCTNDSRLSCNIEIVVTASTGDPLASGAYTVTVTGTGIGETEASFAVGGPAETLSISVPAPLPGLAQSFTATVSVVDKAGVPVADGTWVSFRSTATGGGAPSAVVTGPAESDVDDDNDDSTPTVRQRRSTTKNGEVSAHITVVGNGIAVLTATATANNKSESEPLDTRAAAAIVDAPSGPVLEYNTQSGQATTSAWATYQGADVTTADELLDHAEAPAAARIVWLWNGVQWIRYGEVDGLPLPGSQPFVILPDDTVWFGD